MSDPTTQGFLGKENYFNVVDVYQVRKQFIQGNF